MKLLNLSLNFWTILLKVKGRKRQHEVQFEIVREAINCCPVSRRLHSHKTPNRSLLACSLTRCIIGIIVGNDKPVRELIEGLICPEINFVWTELYLWYGEKNHANFPLEVRKKNVGKKKSGRTKWMVHFKNITKHLLDIYKLKRVGSDWHIPYQVDMSFESEVKMSTTVTGIYWSCSFPKEAPLNSWAT